MKCYKVNSPLNSLFDKSIISLTFLKRLRFHKVNYILFESSDRFIPWYHICYHKVLIMSYIDDVDHLEEQFSPLKNCRKAFIGHATRLINKILEAIENLENTEKVLFLTEQLNVIFEKLKGAIFNFIELSSSPEETENANEILCEQNSRVIEIQNIVENYFETSSKTSKICSSEVSKSKKSTPQRSSSSSSHSKSVHLKAEAELILSQTKERFQRKAKL